MSVWDYIREYRQIALFVLVLSVYAASWRLRQRRPDVEALKKLAAALAGLVPLVFVIGFLAMHRNSELWGAADMMMGFASIAAIERFHAVLDAWKILVGKAPNETLERLAEARSDEPEMAALPPESPEAKKVEQSLVRARIEVRKSVGEEPVAAAAEADADVSAEAGKSNK